MKIPFQNIKPKLLSLTLSGIFLVLLGFIILPRLINMPVFAGAASAWNMEKVGTGMKIYYDTNGAPALYLTNTGYVGVGTTTPLYKLNVKNGSGLTNAVQFENSDWAPGTTGSGLLFQSGAATGNTHWGLQAYTAGAAAAGNIALNAAGGTVGIGTTTPATRLDIRDPRASAINSLGLGTNSGTGVDGDKVNMIFYQAGSGGNSNPATQISSVLETAANSIGGIAFSTGISGNLTEKVRIKNDGNVGIGTAAPAGTLHVAQNDGGGSLGVRAPIIFSRYWASDTDTRASAIFQSYNANNNDILAFGVSGGGGFVTNPANYTNAKMVIQANGRIGMRTVNPTADLHIKQSSNTEVGGGTAGIKLERSDAGGYGEMFIGGDDQLYLFTNSGGARCVLNKTTPGWNCSSDRRLKENIAPLNVSALSLLAKLKPSTFNMKNGGNHTAGFIAQEVEEVLPEAVEKSTVDGFYGLSDSYFTPYLVKGIQELDQETISLKQQVTNQQAQIDLLKQEIKELQKARN